MQRYYNPNRNQNMLVEGIDYQSQIDPVFQQGMLEAMGQRQQRYDQVVLAKAKADAELNDILTVNQQDEALKQVKIDELNNKYKSIAEKHGNDLGLASNDIISFIGNMKQDPFWKLNDYKLKQVEEQNKLIAQLKASGETPFIEKDIRTVPLYGENGYASVSDFEHSVTPTYNYENRRNELWKEALRPEEWSNIQEGEDFRTNAIQMGIYDPQVVKKNQYIYNQYANTKEYEQEIKKLKQDGFAQTNQEADKIIQTRVLEMGKSKEYGRSKNQTTNNSAATTKRNSGYGSNASLAANSITRGIITTIPERPSPLKEDDFLETTKAQANGRNLPLFTDQSGTSVLSQYYHEEDNKYKPGEITELAFNKLNKNEVFKKEILPRMSEEDQSTWNNMFYLKDSEVEKEKIKKDLIAKAKSINEKLNSPNTIQDSKLVIYAPKELDKSLFNRDNQTTLMFNSTNPSDQTVANIGKLYNIETGELITNQKKITELLTKAKENKQGGVVIGEYTLDNPFSFLTGDADFAGNPKQVKINGISYVVPPSLAEPTDVNSQYKKQANNIYTEAKYKSLDGEVPLGKDASVKYNKDDKTFEFSLNGKKVELDDSGNSKTLDFDLGYSNFLDNIKVDEEIHTDINNMSKSSIKSNVTGSKDIIQFKEAMGIKENAGKADGKNLIGARGEFQFMPKTINSLRDSGYFDFGVEEWDNASLEEKDKMNQIMMDSLIKDNIRVINNLGYKIDPNNLIPESSALLAIAHYGGTKAVKAVVKGNQDYLNKTYRYPEDDYKTEWPSIKQDLAKLGFDLDKLNFNKLKKA